MDKKIDKKGITPKRIMMGGFTLIVIAGVIYMMMGAGVKKKLNVELSKISIDTIRLAAFQEFIPIDGVVQPIKTIFIDAYEGGRIDERYVEEGEFVKKGDPILKLSNSDMLLNFMSKETSLLDQLNNLRNTRLSLEQNHNNLKQQQLDVDHSYVEKTREYERSKKLYKEGVIADAEFQKIEDGYNHLVKKRLLLNTTIKRDSGFNSYQNVQLETSSSLIQKNLEMVKQTLDNLVIRAPIDGQLTALNAEIGETKAKGQNIGQVDVLEGYKVKANVDEHYISRIATGLTASFDFDGTEHSLVVKKVFPKVTNGQFQVELEFQGETPKGLKQGQTLQVKLALGAKNNVLLVKRGGFYQAGGGNWIYVLNNGKAVRRDIKLGRQNPQYYEVLEGLLKDEMVITSSYNTFGDSEELIVIDK